MFAMLFGMVAAPTDEELVRRFNDGDRSAYSEIVRRYQNRVFSLCLRWLDDRSTAEEVCQDVFLALYRSLGGFCGDSRLSTWIFRVAINHCKNRSLYRRRRGHGRHDSIDGEPEDPDAPRLQVADSNRGPDIGIQQAEAERVLRAALESLDDEHRQILILRDIDDLAYEEIADLLNVPKGTVKSRLHRARAELARKLRGRVGTADVM